MRSDIIDILLKVGIPANVKGFTYIHDAMELFDSDPYYSSGKICALYADIAKKRCTSPSSVERAIRHAFETATSKGNREMVKQYLDLVNTQNSNLLKTLYLRLKQNEEKNALPEILTAKCDIENCIYKQQLYQEVLEKIAAEMSTYFLQFIDNMKKHLIIPGTNAYPTIQDSRSVLI